MAAKPVHSCECLNCRRKKGSAAVRTFHRKLNWFISTLNTSQRRWFAGLESERAGKSSVRLTSQITGLCDATISRGIAEVQDGIDGNPPKPIRKVGRRAIRDVYPDIECVLNGMISHDVGGDPMSEKKWVRRSSRNLSAELATRGYSVNYHLVCDLLREMGYSMKMNVRHRACTKYSPLRDSQFQYIATQKDTFLAAGRPVISVDTKKKELIGNFRAVGRAWSKSAIEVDEYRFASGASVVAVPYGVYDLAENKGYVFVGTSSNSPRFAVTAIARWWAQFGSSVHIDQKEVLILADGGGSNGFRSRAWKQQIQTILSNDLGLNVTVCHYPPGCSKYNPVERRLFGPISINWSGVPLVTLDVMLRLIRGTATKTGLTVEAEMLEGSFPKGERVTKQEFEDLAIQNHSICGDWNYTISAK